MILTDIGIAAVSLVGGLFLVAFFLTIVAYIAARNELGAARAWKGFDFSATKYQAEVIANQVEEMVNAELVVGDLTPLLAAAEVRMERPLAVPRVLGGSFIYLGLVFALAGLIQAVSRLGTAPQLDDPGALNAWAGNVQHLLGGFGTAFVPAICGVMATIVTTYFVSAVDGVRDKAMASLVNTVYTRILPEAHRLSPDRRDMTLILPAIEKLVDALGTVTTQLSGYPAKMAEVQERHEQAIAAAVKTIQDWDDLYAQRLSSLSAELDESAKRLVHSAETLANEDIQVAGHVNTIADSLEKISASMVPLLKVTQNHAALVEALRLTVDQSKKDLEAARALVLEQNAALATSLGAARSDVVQAESQFVSAMAGIETRLSLNELKLGDQLSNQVSKAGQGLESLAGELRAFVEAERLFQAELQTLYFDLPAWIADKTAEAFEQKSAQRLEILERKLQMLASKPQVPSSKASTAEKRQLERELALAASEGGLNIPRVSPPLDGRRTSPIIEPTAKGWKNRFMKFVSSLRGPK